MARDRADNRRVYEAALGGFEKTRDRTLELVRDLDRSRGARRPAAGGWSPAELVGHLLLTEKVNRGEIERLVALKRDGRRPYINRVISDFPFGAIDYLPRLLLPVVAVPLSFATLFLPPALVELSLRYPVLPAVAPPALTPDPGRPIDELRDELRQSVATTRALFDDNADLDFGEMLVQSPILGVANPMQILRILKAHEQRHQMQLERILDQIGARRAA